MAKPGAVLGPPARSKGLPRARESARGPGRRGAEVQIEQVGFGAEEGQACRIDTVPNER